MAIVCACGCGTPLKVAKYPSHQATWVRGHAPQPRFNRDGAAQRLWANVEKTDTCWNWHGSVRHFGHGHLNVAGRRVLAHRFSWELANGPVPDGMNVCHHCDNPRCVRPDHLFIGTQGDNVRDMVRKGRHAWQQRGDAQEARA